MGRSASRCWSGEVMRYTPHTGLEVSCTAGALYNASSGLTGVVTHSANGGLIGVPAHSAAHVFSPFVVPLFSCEGLSGLAVVGTAELIESGLNGVALTDSAEPASSGLSGVLSSTSLSGVFEMTGSCGLLRVLAWGESVRPGLECGGVVGSDTGQLVCDPVGVGSSRQTDSLSWKEKLNLSGVGSSGQIGALSCPQTLDLNGVDASAVTDDVATGCRSKL